MKIKKKYVLILFLIFLVIILSYKFYFAPIFSYEYRDIERLKSLPYLSWTEEEINENNSGVTKYIPEKSFPGYNLYLDEVDKAYLIDMHGKIVHTWNFPIKGQWEYGVILEDGSLVALLVGEGIAKFDWDSNLLWFNNITAHHDIEVLEDGSYLVPFNYYKKYKKYNVLFDSIMHISSKGENISEVWSTYKNLNKINKFHNPSPLESDLGPPDSSVLYEYYHLNTIRILPDTLLGKIFKPLQKGNLLVCLRNENLILILDKDTKEIVWYWGPDNLDHPHYPTMLKNGNILIFDNGRFRNYSRVIQVDPTTKEIVWEYKTDPLKDFYSELRGSSQPLPNNNILITESEKGHVFEITKEGEIVWEFWNPEIKNSSRKRIYRMIRYPE